MAGKRVNLSELADEPPLEDARVPSFAESTPHTARVNQVAANPLNTRDVHADPNKIVSIANSMRTHGQLQPCTVVSRSAFLAIYPEHESSIGDALFVQVTGGRRRAAAIHAEISTLDIKVSNDLAQSRAQFVSATAAENIDREDLDPIEEAKAVQLLVQEAGSGKAAAEQLARTPPWVTQRLNLLKLVPELQAAVRAGEVPLREVRDLHKRPPGEQVKALAAWRAAVTGGPELTAVNSQAAGDTTTQRPAANGRIKLSPAASAIRRLGHTPDRIAESLRAEMTPEDLRVLIEFLTRAL